MRETILFDLGGVFLNINYQLTIEAFEKLGMTDFTTHFTQANQKDLFDDVETGKISPMVFINGLLDHLPAGTSANQVVHAWNAMLLDWPMHRLEKVQELRKNHTVLLLSNTNLIHLDCANRKLKEITDQPFDHFFDKVYLSHEIGYRKPNADCFEFVLNDANKKAEEVVFFDDSAQHIEGAKKLGIEAHLLTGEVFEHPYFGS